MTPRQAPRQRQAPAFQLEVRAPFSWRLGTALLWSLALATTGAAVAAQAGHLLGPAAAAVCGGATLMLLPLAGRQAWRFAAGESWQLQWDGQHWWLRAGAACSAAAEDAPRRAVELQVAVDLGVFLLLRARPAVGVRGRAVYLPLTRRQHPALWLRLRWALFSARHLPPAPA